MARLSTNKSLCFFILIATINNLFLSPGVHCQSEGSRTVDSNQGDVHVWRLEGADWRPDTGYDGPGNKSEHEESLMRNTRRLNTSDNDGSDGDFSRNRKQYVGVNEWRQMADGSDNCSRCVVDLVRALKRDLQAEEKERKSLERMMDTYQTELYELRGQLHRMDTRITPGLESLPLTAKGTVSFSAKLSYNRELRPLDTIVFDSVLSNQGQGYDPDSGLFTAPIPGTYLFHSTILSGYNTKVETAILANDKEICRIYSGSHDAHGSGSNMAILDLHSNDIVRVRLLYQGGNHVHGHYSSFSGVMLAEKDED